jgi:hypothetical protein
VPGDLEYDIPQKITHARMSGSEVMCQVEWKKRYDNSKPKQSYVSNKILKQQYPKLLLDYYESKIKIEKKD